VTEAAVELVIAGVAHPHARAWVEAARALPQVRLAGVWDPRPERAREFADRHGAPELTLDEVGDRPTLALVAGRNDELADLALEVLRHDLPVLVEKPGALDTTGLRRIEAEADSRGRRVFVAYFLRFADTVRTARELIDEGALGDLTLARFHVGMPALAWEDLPEWFADPTNVRGMFLEDGCHVVDIALHLLGDPSDVTGVALEQPRPGGLGESAFAATLRYESVLAVVDFSAWEANSWVESWGFELYGTRGTLRAGLMPPWAELYGGDGWRRIGVERPLDGQALEAARVAAHRSYFRRALGAAADAVLDRGGEPATLAEARRVFDVIEAAYAGHGSRTAAAASGEGRTSE
jgi:predicted dehydrogenase